MFGASILEQYPTKMDVSPMIYEIIVLFFSHKNKLVFEWSLSFSPILVGKAAKASNDQPQAV